MQLHVQPALLPGSLAIMETTTTTAIPRPHAACGFSQGARGGRPDDERLLHSSTGSGPVVLQERTLGPRPAALRRRSRGRAGIECDRRHVALRSVQQRAALIALIEAALSVDCGDLDDATNDKGGPI